MNRTTGNISQVECAQLICVRGLVQGVGMRPAVWRLAKHHALRGTVANDGQGLTIHVCGGVDNVEEFVQGLYDQAPLLARIDSIERSPAEFILTDVDFRIIDSSAGEVQTGVAPDAAPCADCTQEFLDPFSRRYRYPFTNCSHCGPRLSIIDGIPYDRAATTMRTFEMCADCAGEYENPEDRRFHAQPIACYACGPLVRLERSDCAAIALDSLSMLDAVDATCTLLQRGHIVAIKGLGGYQLACDATKSASVGLLRDRKHRQRKPFALMVSTVDMVKQYAIVNADETALLESSAAPIVILQAKAPEEGVAQVVGGVAPGVNTLGFMLPNSPLHRLVLRRMKRPIVLTSGNLSDEPQCIDEAEARQRLGDIAEYFLLHDRPITRRVDDSVMRVFNGAARVLRRARGYAPVPLPLPAGFEATPSVLALGGELKNTFCLLHNGEAIISHHMGDLENAPTYADYCCALADYQRLYEHTPGIIAVDRHPEYISSKLGRERAEVDGIKLEEVQHHHAHIAACMAENQIPFDAGPVIGVALDGLGYGQNESENDNNDGALWGGEFMLADYCQFQRMGTFKPVALLGGAQAMHEPWRNTYAQLCAQMGWARFAMNYADLDLFAFLDSKPRELLDSMLAGNVNSPLASSCGRLFDAVAAAAGVCREQALYEGQAAIEFEALVDSRALTEESEDLAYPFAIPRLNDGSNLPYIEPLAMWQALLGDMILKTPVGVISARFHRGLAKVVAKMVEKISDYETGEEPIRTVVLSGGVFQNRILLEQVSARLEALDFRVLTHQQVPANDGGLSLGQAVVAAARAISQPGQSA